MLGGFLYILIYSFVTTNKRLTYFKKTKLSDLRNQYVLSLFGKTCWASIHYDKCSWFRLFGRGLMWKHEDQGLRFSERVGSKKYIKLGKWIIEYLPK
jgi:hypothetical protein